MKCSTPVHVRNILTNALSVCLLYPFAVLLEVCPIESFLAWSMDYWGTGGSPCLHVHMLQ